MAVTIHPIVDNGISKGADNFSGGTLRCKCATDPIEVEIQSQVLFNHACGCSQCWKPPGATFAVIGVVPVDKVHVKAHGEKLRVANDQATIRRHACVACGVHMYGRIDNQNHAFHGLDFIHPELSDQKGWDGPGFAAFVSSIIESGTPPKQMDEVRKTLRDKGLEPYDSLNPVLMDLLATQAAKLKGTYRET
ncbi:S-(hydroxymethyl)glutathione synthase [soil metagenome]